MRRLRELEAGRNRERMGRRARGLDRRSEPLEGMMDGPVLHARGIEFNVSEAIDRDQAIIDIRLEILVPGPSMSAHPDGDSDYLRRSAEKMGEQLTKAFMTILEKGHNPTTVDGITTYRIAPDPNRARVAPVGSLELPLGRRKILFEE